MDRIIAHLDMNSYFASVEQQANPFLIGKPVGICGKGNNERTVVAAASREAKKIGVKSGFGIWEAQKLCPHLIVIPADYAKYQDISGRVIHILEHYSDMIEIFSIDEAFFELTYTCKFDWGKASKAIIKIKQELKNGLGEWLTASVGIAKNKLIAKLASESKKPDGFTTVQPQDTLNFLFKHQLDDLCGIGRQTKQRLNSLGIYTLKELNKTPLTILRQEFGKISGTYLFLMARGIDNSPVIDSRQLPLEKSFGHSYTLPSDITDKEEIFATIYKLCEKTCRRTRLKNMCGKNIGLYIRFNDFTGFATQKKLDHYIDTGEELYTSIKILFKQCKVTKPVRLVGVSLGSVIEKNARPVSLWQINQKKILCQNSLDKIQDHYGDFAIFPASMVKILKKIQNIPDSRNPRIISNALMKRYG